ncbi:hypothetical protein [Microbispora hainanensis]|uniref:hypothetical protein n=1 Tax=Microbispora hainanensis TaxID=568844 RepID=UPI001ABF5381|nr:hypothetical protein [Microbispora hainanensis]
MQDGVGERVEAVRADVKRPGTLADLLTESLLTAATTLRTRYLAIFELQLESARRPALAAALARLQDTAVLITAGHHDELGLDIPLEKIPAMIERSAR